MFVYLSRKCMIGFKSDLILYLVPSTRKFDYKYIGTAYNLKHFIDSISRSIHVEYMYLNPLVFDLFYLLNL